MPNQSRPQRPRGAQTRERILGAAEATLLEHGFGAVTLAAVCERAAVSRGSYLHHFPTRDVLLAAIAERGAARFADALATVPAEPIEETVRALWEVVVQPSTAAWLEVVLAARTDPELTDVVRDGSTRIFAVAAEALPQLPRPILLLVLALLNGLSLDLALDVQQDEAENLRAALPSLVSASLTVNPSRGGP